MRKATYTLDGEKLEGGLAGFLAKNLDELTEQEIRRACELREGETLKLGGGAAPIFTLERGQDEEDDVLVCVKCAQLYATHPAPADRLCGSCRAENSAAVEP